MSSAQHSESWVVKTSPGGTTAGSDRVREVTRGPDLPEAAYREVIYRLAAASELRDDETGNHIARMASNAYLIGRELGLGRAFLSTLLLASPMHDLGKIGIPDAILLKPGRLTRSEFDMVKEHTLIGARMLSGSQSPLLRTAETIARTHHESFDGRGYPHGLMGDAIPLTGRITAVADVFDALTSPRPYKTAYPVEAAVDIIIRGSGTHFDPEVVRAFQQGLDKIVEVRSEFEDHFPMTGRGASAGSGGGVVHKLAALETRFLREEEEAPV